MTINAQPTTRIESGFAHLDKRAWDALNLSGNPFVSHDFLSLLELSGSIGPGTGWRPVPILIEQGEHLLAALPAFLKSHSRGEYVFDHSWADAWEHAGGHYYPKLQASIPFTPANGPRLLMRDPKWAPALIAAAQNLVNNNNLSSAHATFISPEQRDIFARAGWLMRSDIQFHWQDQGYGDFDGFLASLSSRKRKQIRKERERARQGLEIIHLTGSDIRESHWDDFWHFYQDTGMRKWGQPYLTRPAFSLMGEKMADRVLLIFAKRGEQTIAGALNFIGKDTLYGRYWGCSEFQPFLHFELCYYQAIELALSYGLANVEAGAQGGHKMARGYAPVETWSAHYIAHEDFRDAVAEFLERERIGVSQDKAFLMDRLPYRKTKPPGLQGSRE